MESLNYLLRQLHQSIGTTATGHSASQGRKGKCFEMSRVQARVGPRVVPAGGRLHQEHDGCHQEENQPKP